MTNARTETEPMGDVMLERDGSDDAAMDSAGSVSGKADSDVVVDSVCVCVDSGADDNDSNGWMVLWFLLWKEWPVLVRVCVLVEVRTDTETEMATDALIDGNPSDGLSISLRSL